MLESKAKDRGRILLVDDSELVRAIVGGFLRDAGFDVREAADGSSALRSLERDCFDVVITDLKMPTSDGIEVLAAVKERAIDTEVIILTGTHAHDIEYALRALRLGAHDFMAKPLSSAAQMVLTVDRAIEKKRLRDANLRLLRELEELSRTDPLTGAHNRRSFDETLDFELGRARRYRFPLSLCLVDLDHFKRINDILGHVGGDAVLRAFVTLADDVLRSGDRLYRYGGEEFAIILPNTGLSGACRTAQRLIEHVRASSIRHGDRIVPVTCSAGIAGLEAVGDDRPTLVARADAALYEAKRTGRDRVCTRRYLAAVSQSRPV